MYQGDFVSVIGGLGYRPGIVKEVGKRTVLIEWADEKTERVDIKRIVQCKDLKEKAFIERMFYLEEQINHDKKGYHD